jgi:hypothetical protein
MILNRLDEFSHKKKKNSKISSQFSVSDFEENLLSVLQNSFQIGATLH